MTAHPFEFTSKFRHHAFGWRSQLPIQRIKEAVRELRNLSRKEPILAAEGAVLFLEKLSGALEQVDSSSGAIGNAVNQAIDVLVPLISKPVVAEEKRHHWLKRLWEALENDGIPYIESLGDNWGELCTTPKIASLWADEFIDCVKHISDPHTTGHHFFKGTIPCLSALFAAKRYPELLDLLTRACFKWWGYQRWGVKALVAMGQPQQALQYAENAKGLNTPTIEFAQVCEEILIGMGLTEEAYTRYALEANQNQTNLATFRTLTQKYPHKLPITILRDLIASRPGEEGKWFAAAKSAGFFDCAIELVSENPTDPRTLIRAAKEFSTKQPHFAMASGIASLRWIREGYGYEISTTDVRAAYAAIIEAAQTAGMNPAEIKTKISDLLSHERLNTPWVKKMLMPDLSEPTPDSFT